MTSEGHLLFSISCVVFAKKIGITSTLTHGDWWHVVPAAMLTCFLPDIDHPKSLLGRRLKWISRPISKIFRHRGFTHSLFLVTFATLIVSYFTIYKKWILQPDVVQGMILGYTSHIIADVLTPSGVPILWPCQCRFRLPILVQKKNNRPELIFSSLFLILALCIPEIIALNNISYWLLQTIHFFKMKFDLLSSIISSILEKNYIYYDLLLSTGRKYFSLY